MMHEQSRLYDELPEHEADSRPDGGAEAAVKSDGDNGGEEFARLAFEEAFARLEDIVNRLEGGHTSLEESLRLFEEGVRLARLCRSRLDRAERRIRVLVDGREGDAERQIADALEAEVAGDGDSGR